MSELSSLAQDRRMLHLVKAIPPFVGRKQQMDWLEHCLQDILAGRPRLVLMQGEAGIGKTRLLKEAQNTFLPRGLQIYTGRCHEHLTLPYVPFVEALFPRLERLLTEMSGSHEVDGDTISRLLHPERFAVSPTLLSRDDQEKLRLFLAVSHATIMLAQTTPTLFVMDDLHWADQPSLELFAHLVFTVADMAMRTAIPLLLIGTYRPPEAESRLARMLARLQREEICQTWDIPRLSELEIYELLHGLGLARPSPQLLTTVSETTQGNPLFIQELLYHLVKHNALQERAGGSITMLSAPTIELPEEIIGAIRVRAGALSPACQNLLTLASLLGDRFLPQILALVSAQGEEEVLELLEEAFQQRLLVSEDQYFQFAHPLIQHVFYSAPSMTRRQRLHWRIAQMLEQIYAACRTAHLLEITHHMVHAGPAATRDKIVYYARQAGDQAMGIFDWGKAAYYYTAALRAAESGADFTVQERAALHYVAGRAYYRDGDIEACAEHYEQAIAAYRLAGDVAGLAQALVGKMRVGYMVTPYGIMTDIQPLEEVLLALGEHEPGLGGALLSRIAEAYRVARQFDRATAMARHALVLGQGIADDHLCSEASFRLALVQYQSLHFQEALEHCQQAHAHAQRVHDPWLAGPPLQRAALLTAMLGRLDEAAAMNQEAAVLARKTQRWSEYSQTLSCLVWLAAIRGQFADAERHAHETMLMVSRSRYPLSGVSALSALACVHALRGAWTAADETLDNLIAPGHLFNDVGPVLRICVQVFRAWLQAQQGEPCTVPLAALATDLMRIVGIDGLFLAPVCALIELGDCLAMPSAVAEVSQALSLAVERGALLSRGWVFCVPRVLGVGAMLQQQWEKAESYFQRALDAATTAGARPELARTYLDYGRMLLARGLGADQQRALGYIEQARALCNELGMLPFGQAAARLSAALQPVFSATSYPPTPSEQPESTLEVTTLFQVAHREFHFLA